jgi:hypothetical protein
VWRPSRCRWVTDTRKTITTLAMLGSLLGATLFYVTPVSIRLLPVGTASISIDKAEACIGRAAHPDGQCGRYPKDASACVLRCSRSGRLLHRH